MLKDPIVFSGLLVPIHFSKIHSRPNRIPVNYNPVLFDLSRVPIHFNRLPSYYLFSGSNNLIEDSYLFS